MARIGVIGLGNVLMGDGAVGPHVVKTLEAYFVFPHEVALIDAGTPGLDLTAHVAGLEMRIPGDTENARLAELIQGELSGDFAVYVHGQVPPGDGGIALGQALVGGAISS
jgi:hypothetical protein